MNLKRQMVDKFFHGIKLTVGRAIENENYRRSEYLAIL